MTRDRPDAGGGGRTGRRSSKIERAAGELAERLLGASTLAEASAASLDAAMALTASDRGCAGRVDTQIGAIAVSAFRPGGEPATASLCVDPWRSEPFRARDRGEGGEEGAWTLTVPALSGGVVVGRLGLARASGAYRTADVEGVVRLAGLYGRALARLSFEERLAAVGEQDDTLFDSHPDGVAIIADRRFVKVSPAFAQLLGRTPDELLGRVPTEFVVAQEHEVVRTRMATAQGGTRERPSEYTVIRPDGTEVPAEAVTRVIGWGGRPAFLVVFRDTSARRAVEAELRRRQDLLQALADFDAEIGHLRSESVVESALRFLKSVVPLDRYSVALRDAGGQGARLLCVAGEEVESLVPGTVVSLEEGTVLGRATAGGHAVYVPDLRDEPPGDALVQELCGAGLRSLLVVPLAAGGTSLGALNVTSRQADGVSEAQRELLSLLAPRLAAALQNSVLHEELQQSEKRYRHIFDSVPVSIWEEDFSELALALRRLRAEGVDDMRAYLAANPAFGFEAATMIRVIDVNEYTLRLYQATTKEELFGALDRVFTEDSYPAFVEQIVALAEGRRQYECEGMNRTLRGQPLTVMVKAEFPPLEGDYGRVTVSLTDISRRREAEEALRYRTRFETLISSISTHFLNLEPGRAEQGISAALESLGRFADADRAYAALFSPGRGGIGRVFDWRRSEELPSVREWEGASIEGFPWFAGHVRQGRTLAVGRTAADPPPCGSPEQERLAARDVRSLIMVPIASQGGIAGLVGLDAIGRDRTWPDDTESLLKIVGETFVSALERERVQEDLRRARDELELRVRERTADLERAKRELEEDMVARERAEAEKLLLERQLRQGRVFEAVGQLAGGVAHDFNNILGSVIGCLYAARLQAGDRPAVLEELDRAQVLCRRGGDLTRQLLTVARRQPGRPAPLRLSELLAEVRPLLERTLPKDIDLRVELEEGLPPVRADRSMLTAALLNLCLNARDAMPRGGTLCVTAWQDEAAAGAGWVSVRVSDTGVGIPVFLHDRIFDPFFTTKAPGEGTGLGLAMVEATARECGGVVSLQSRPSEGSTFTLRLPAAAEPALPLAGGAPQARHPLVASPILVVEDEEDVARMVCQVLEARGYATLRAATGLEALDQVRRFDGALGLVILDLVLPELGGEEVHRILRAIVPEVAVLLITGREDLAHAHLSDVPLLPKPFTSDELLAAVAEQLGHRGGAAR